MRQSDLFVCFFSIAYVECFVLLYEKRKRFLFECFKVFSRYLFEEYTYNNSLLNILYSKGKRFYIDASFLVSVSYQFYPYLCYDYLSVTLAESYHYAYHSRSVSLLKLIFLSKRYFFDFFQDSYCFAIFLPTYRTIGGDKSFRV